MCLSWGLQEVRAPRSPKEGSGAPPCPRLCANVLPRGQLIPSFQSLDRPLFLSCDVAPVSSLGQRAPRAMTTEKRVGLGGTQSSGGRCVGGHHLARSRSVGMGQPGPAPAPGAGSWLWCRAGASELVASPDGGGEARPGHDLPDATWVSADGFSGSRASVAKGWQVTVLTPQAVTVWLGGRGPAQWTYGRWLAGHCVSEVLWAPSNQLPKCQLDGRSAPPPCRAITEQSTLGPRTSQHTAGVRRSAGAGH